MSDLEEAATVFFRAIRTAGKEILGHDQFGFKIDINTMVPAADRDGAVLLGAKLQEAITVAGRAVQPVTIEGTSLQ